MLWTLLVISGQLSWIWSKQTLNSATQGCGVQRVFFFLTPHPQKTVDEQERGILWNCPCSPRSFCCALMLPSLQFFLSGHPWHPMDFTDSVTTWCRWFHRICRLHLFLLFCSTWYILIPSFSVLELSVKRSRDGFYSQFGGCSSLYFQYSLAFM